MGPKVQRPRGLKTIARDSLPEVGATQTGWTLVKAIMREGRPCIVGSYVVKKILVPLSIIVFLTGSLTFIKEIDEEYFDTNIRNFYGLYIKNEYWGLEDINFAENNILKYSEDNFINIAHGLGGRNTDKENAYEGFDIASSKGFKFFEVDIFLDPAGNLNCSHDEPKFETLCNLEDLLRKVHAKKSYLIIDIKSDFHKTFNLIAKKAESKYDPMWSSLILQIYKPKELDYYSTTAAHYKFFNPPIISTYKSNRKISDTCKELAHTGIDTIALSIRKASLQHGACKEFNIIVHPVRSCSDIEDLKNISGIFTNSETKSCQT